MPDDSESEFTPTPLAEHLVLDPSLDPVWLAAIGYAAQSEATRAITNTP